LVPIQTSLNRKGQIHKRLKKGAKKSKRVYETVPSPIADARGKRIGLKVEKGLR